MYMLAGNAPGAGIGAAHSLHAALRLHLGLGAAGAGAIAQLGRFLDGLLQSHGQRTNLGLALAIVVGALTLGATAGLAEQASRGSGAIPAAAGRGFAGPPIAILANLGGFTGSTARGCHCLWSSWTSWSSRSNWRSRRSLTLIIIVAIPQLGVNLGQHEQVIGQLPYLVRQVHTLAGTATAQEVGGIRVPAVESVQVALHAALLLGGGLAAGVLIEVLVEQMLRRGRGRAGGVYRWEQLLPGLINGRGHRVGTLVVPTALLILLWEIRILGQFVVGQGVNRFAGRRGTNCKWRSFLEGFSGEDWVILHTSC